MTRIRIGPGNEATMSCIIYRLDSRFNVSRAVTEYSGVSLYQEVLGSDHHSNVDEGENSQEAEDTGES